MGHSAAPATRARSERSEATRDAILAAAERLFAEHGVLAVSNRQVGEAAGQGNNTAVGYHFGDKAGLVRAISARHTAAMDELRVPLVEAAEGSADIRDWVTCYVRPITDHLGALGAPTWYARFGAQLMTDPEHRRIMVEEAIAAPSLHVMLDGLRRCVPELAPDVRNGRSVMARLLLMHTCAERERDLANGPALGAAEAAAAWRRTSVALVDALVGLWTAPVTPR